MIVLVASGLKAPSLALGQGYGCRVLRLGPPCSTEMELSGHVAPPSDERALQEGEQPGTEDLSIGSHAAPQSLSILAIVTNEFDRSLPGLRTGQVIHFTLH